MRALLAVLLLAALAGCSTFPEDGPSSRSVPHEASQTPAKYALVDLDYSVSQTVAAHPPQPLLSLAGQSSALPTDEIAEGDVLTVSIFESTGGGLFSSSTAGPGATASGASQSTLPGMTVDPQGNLSVPYAGLLQVAGLTPLEASKVIARALSKRTINPQVTVTVVSSNANSVTIIGEVHTPGRFLLTPHNDRLVDVLATAGGPTKNSADLLVVVGRGARFSEIQLSDLMANPSENIRLAPHDQVRVLDKTRKYSTFGALRAVSQTPIEDDNVTLADAISRAGGLDTNTANASWVLVFRFERPEIATALNVTLPQAAKGVPIVYRLDLRKPDRLFVAQSFDIRADDMIYVPRSDISEAKKFFDFVNDITQIGYNLRQASTIP
jgi:polysaccharide export outer membrane protein